MHSALKGVDWYKVGLGIATAMSLGGNVSQGLDLGAAGQTQELCCTVANACNQNGFLENVFTSAE